MQSCPATRDRCQNSQNATNHLITICSISSERKSNRYPTQVVRANVMICLGMPKKSISVSYGLTVAAAQGSRTYFEDRIAIHADLNCPKPYLYCSIFDGHGGSEAAEFGQKNIFDILQKTEGFLDDDDERCFKAFATSTFFLNEKMRLASAEWRKNSIAGTTMASVLVTKKKIYLSHLGDSPVFIFMRNRHGRLICDLAFAFHTPDRKNEAERIVNAGGEIVEKNDTLFVKVPGAHNQIALSRALGNFWAVRSPKDRSGKIVSAMPEVAAINLSRRIQFVVAASDGILQLPRATMCRVLEHCSQQMKNGVFVNPAQSLLATLTYLGRALDNVTIACYSFSRSTKYRGNYLFNGEHGSMCISSSGEALSLNSFFTKYRDVALTMDDRSRQSVSFRTTLPPYAPFKNMQSEVDYEEPGFIKIDKK